VDERDLVYAPRAQRDLLDLSKRDARRVLEDLEILRVPPWPPGKVKKLRGQDYWEIKTGDYRTIFWPQGMRVVILRVVNRRDLERTLGRIDVHTLVEWLQGMDEREHEEER
jgi:mRNA-degrading endonuclease RelE of RelBE toxin-antitoxin system